MYRWTLFLWVLKNLVAEQGVQFKRLKVCHCFIHCLLRAIGIEHTIELELNCRKVEERFWERRFQAEVVICVCVHWKLILWKNAALMAGTISNLTVQWYWRRVLWPNGTTQLEVLDLYGRIFFNLLLLCLWPASKPTNLQKDHLQLEATRSIVHGRNLKRIAKKGKCKMWEPGTTTKCSRC
jgi:hypothetical protein